MANRKIANEMAVKEILGMTDQAEPEQPAQEQSTPTSVKKIQRAYYIEEDLDYALKRMALEQRTNVSALINDIIRKAVSEK